MVQSFTFHREAGRLRADVRTWQIAVSAEAVIMLLLGLFATRGRVYILLFTPCYFAFVWWLYSRPLRRRHTLTESTLTLVEPSGTRFPIPREQILAIERFTEPLPHGVRPVGFRHLPEADMLYILPDKQSLVRISLNRPVTVRIPPHHTLEFATVVCQVDEPEAFMAAILPDNGNLREQGEAGGQVKVATASSPNNPAETGPAGIELCDLTKRFGDYTAVDGLTLRAAPGEILAFLGSNGAGKSTTIKMMVGLLRPTGGRVLIGGQDPWRDLSARRLVGYVPDVPLLYENLTAREHLWLVGGLYDLPDREARERARALLEQVGLERYGDQPVRSFSLGMKRKLSIVSALMHRPPVLLLDEATNGLDPRAAREVKDFISEAARQGTTIFLTTHLLDVVSELAHRIAIIDQGVLRACGTAAELQAAFGRPGGSLEEIFLLATTGPRKEAAAT